MRGNLIFLIFCFYSEPVKSVTVYLGAHNIGETFENNRERYIGYSFVRHSNWNSNTMAGDIALINLTTTVTYSSKDLGDYIL